MSHNTENSVAVESLPVSELHIIEESEWENDLSDKKIIGLKDLETGENVESADSDVCLNYDSDSHEKEEKIQDKDATSGGDKNTYIETTDSGSEDNGSGGKDSGCEVSGNLEESKTVNKPDEEETPFEPPDEELANRIMAQVEFYFSDENIAKDAFLLKHVRRNKEGYVSLKLISSFKRIKHLAKDWRAVAYALEKSTKLEVNDTKTKLRRVNPLPLLDQTTPSRTIVAINLPTEKNNIESVAEMFKDFGVITLVRILRPGTCIPGDVRSFANKHPEVNDTLSALIEFERTESAKAAIDRVNADWRTGGMKVLELNAPSGEKKKRVQSKKTIVRKLMDNELSSSCQSSSETEMDVRFYRRRSSSPIPVRATDVPRLQRRYSANRDSATNFACQNSFRERPPCGCCNHYERRYSSSGSGYDSPVPNHHRHYSIGKDASEAGYQIPALRRFSGVENECCLLRRCSRDSDSSGSYTRFHDIGRRYSRDSISSNESGLQRRFSRDSISSESVGNFRRLSRDSIGSDVFAPPFLSRSNSKDIIEMPRRSSHGSLSTCGYHPLAHSGSRTTFFTQLHPSTNSSPHVPENVVRMPKGPDGSKGFGVA